MRHVTLALVLLLVLTGCGAPDKANEPPATPAATMPAKSAPTALASPVLALPTTLSPRPLAALPLAEALFQPGDLPDGVVPGPVDQALLLNSEVPPDLAQLITDSMPLDMELPDRGFMRDFTQAGYPDGYGAVTLYSYSNGTPVKPLYQWMMEWENTSGVPQPNIGEQAVLSLSSYNTDDMTLFFMVCHTAVRIWLRAPADQQVLLHYARRLAQRITAVDCDGAAAVPLLTPAPIAPPPTPAPTVAITQDGAATITRLPDPDGESIVRAYSFADADHGWLARGATILATRDGGQTWREQFRTDSEVQAITFVSATRGWIETERGLILTEDSGATWQPISTTPEDGPRRMPRPPKATMCGGLSPLHFASVDQQTGWMLCLGEPATGSQEKALFQTVDGGTSWQMLVGSDWEQPTALSVMGYANDMFFLDAQHGWIGQSRGGLLATVDGGQTWQQVPTPGEAATWVDQVQFLSTTVGFARAPQKRGLPTLFRTDDGGATWRAIYTAPSRPRRPNGPTQFFADGSGIGAVERWKSAAFLRSTDAGRTWAQIEAISDICGAFTTSVCDLSFADPQHGWATITCARSPLHALYRTEDGGATWSRMAAPGPPDDPPVGISFVDQRTGYLVSAAGYLWRTDDAGATWAAVDQQAAHTRSLAFVTATPGWELRGTQLFATADGGQSWRAINLVLPIQQFALLPNGQAWALAGEAATGPLVLATSNGGQT